MAGRTTLVLSLLLLAALAGALVLWGTGGGGGSRDPGANAAAAARPDDAVEAGPVHPADLARPRAPAAEPTPVAATAEPPAMDDAREVAATRADAELDEGHWVSGRVVFPEGTPPGEPVEILADGKDFEERELHRVLAAPDGTFRVAFSKRTRTGRLRLDAPHLYLESGVRIKTGAIPEEVVLEPRLGGQIVGRLELPELSEEELAEVRAQPVRLSAWSEGARRATTREATPDEALAFELRGVPALSHVQLSFEPEPLVPAYRDGLAIVPGETETVELELELGARLAGRVVDAAGSPVPDVDVFAQHQVWHGAYSAQNEHRGEVAPDGGFSIRGVSPGPVTVVARRQGMAPAELDLGELADGERREDLVLVLETGGRISGIVRWPDGRPAVDADVVVEEQALRDDWALPDTVRRKHVETGLDGRFELTGLGEGLSDVTAEARPDWPEDSGGVAGSPSEEDLARVKVITAAMAGEGEDAEDAARELKRLRRKLGRNAWVASATNVEPDADLVLTLTSGLAIEGVVYGDQGRPLEDFFVAATPHDEQQPWAESPYDTVRRRFEDTGGSFRLEGLREGSWKVTADAKGYSASHELVVRLPEDSEPLQIVLGRTSSVSGRVVEPDGSPAGSASVSYDTDRSDGTVIVVGGSQKGATACEEDGSFTLEDVPSEPLRMVARAPGFAASEALELDLAPGETLEGLSFALRLGGTIAGELVPRAGSSRAGREIQASRRGERWERASARTDAAGRFVLAPLTPGRWEVEAPPSREEQEEMRDEDGDMDWSLRQAATLSARADVVDGGTVHVVLGVPPEDAIRLYGLVTRGGRPVAGARVSAFQMKSHASKNALAGDDGLYELYLDEPGAWQVSVGVEALGVHSGHVVEVPEVDAWRLDLELGTGRIAGHVLGPDGPVEGEGVSLTRGRIGIDLDLDEGWVTGNTTTDEAGKFAFDGLDAGHYTLQAGGLPWMSKNDESLGTAVLENLELAAGEVLDGLELRLGEGVTIRGKVTYNGQPWVNAQLFFRDAEGRFRGAWQGVSSSSSGHYECSSLDPGTWTVRAQSGSFVSRDSAPIALASGEEGEVDVELVQGTMLRVRLTDATGQPVEPVIRVTDPAGLPETNYTTWEMRKLDPETTLQEGTPYGPLPPGTWTVTAFPQGGGPVAKTQVTLGAEGGELQVDLQLSD